MTDAEPEVIAQNWEFRVAKLQMIEKKQFQMVYYGKMVWNDIEEMSSSERDRIYDILYETKKTEKEEYEKAMREAKAKQASHGSRRARRH